MSCTKRYQDSASVVGTCPDDADLLLFSNASDGVQVFRTWATVKGCILSGIFGTGILTITGADLDGSNQYFNSSLINQLVVFYNGINRFLLHNNSDETYPASEWKYIKSGVNVIAIQILIPVTFSSADVFTIFPNPNGQP